VSIGLDLGSSHFRSLRRQGNRLAARSCRAVYAIVLDNPARRSMFAEGGVPFAEFGSNLILFGDAAEEWAAKLRVSTIPLVVHGRLPVDDAVIRQVVTALIEGLLPTPSGRDDECCLTLPAGIERTAPAAADFLTRVVRSFGYQPRIASSSLAVALSELSASGVTGLGMYLGETRSELSIVRQGRELACCEIPRGVLSDPADVDAAMDPALRQQEILRELFATAAYELNHRPEWKSIVPPISLAIAGEFHAAPGLAALLPGCIPHASWPFALGTLRIAAEPIWAVGRGCLIQAELEALTALARPAA
jgi:hypothetical protein